MTVAVILASALLTLGRVTADLRDGWMFSRDGGAWRPVEVPHDWAIEGPFDPEGDPSTGKLPWKGKGRYRRTLVLDRAPAGERLWLDCEGVMMRSRVYVNGRACGRGEYGYLGFRTDLTPYLAAGTNTIEIAADTTAFHSRWYPGGGLYRPVRLVRASDVYLDERDLSVTTPRVSSAEAAVRVTGKVTSRRTKPAGASVTVRLVDPSGAEAGRAERTVSLVPCGEADFAADFTVAAPKLWKLERNAALYTVEVSVRGEGAEDAVAVRTGLRSFRFDPKRGFFLNGERVQLKGVDLHGDLGVLGTAYDRSAMRRQLEVMRDMGANALRTSHNPAAPETMDLCDEMGIFVWNECFDKWEDTSGRDEEPEEAFVERQLRRFVRRDRNHPCVFVWSVGNEIPFSEPLPAGSDWKGRWVNVYGTTPERCWRFANLVRALDPTRPVALGCCRPEGVARGDYAAFDLTGWNYNGQYGTMARAYPEKPVLYSESASAFSEVGCYPEHVATNKTDYPVSLRATDSYDRTAASWSDIPDREFERMERDTYVGGEFVWTGIDYLGEPSPYADPKAHGGIPVRELSRSSHFGICDLTVRPKDRYWLYRSHWNREAFTLHLVPEHWNFAGRKTLPVYVYTSADEAELFVNGVSQGRRKKDPAASSDAGYYGILPRYRLMWDAVPYAPGEVKAVAYGRDGRVLGERALKTADAPAKVVLEPEKPVLKAGELLFVNVSLADAKGVFVPDRRDRITFRVEGSARIVSVGNGDPRGLDSFKDISSHPLFAGRAVVVLRRTGAGPVTLFAEAPGLEMGRFVSSVLCAATACVAEPADFVDPFVGTTATGHTFPGACVPFGLVQASPDTGNGTWDYCSGYRFEDKTIWGFSQTHLNGTGCPDLGDVLVQPFAAKEIAQVEKTFRGRRYIASVQDKSAEVAVPGYYAATLSDFGVRAEVTATARVALYRFTYNGEGPARLLVDTQYGMGGDPTKQIVESDVRLTDKTGLCGTNRRKCWVDRRYSFAVVFDRACTAVEELPKQPGEKAPRYAFDFDLRRGESLLVKVALSAEGGVAGAQKNLAAELPGWDFEAVRAAARAQWNGLLGQVVVEGDEAQKRNFYTSLYHLYVQPNDIADAGDSPLYSTFSCWDTFRAAGPLYTILCPDRAAAFVDSMLEQGRRTGYLPIWTLWGKENQCMIGTHSVPMIVDAWLKGTWKGNAEAAYRQIRETLTKKHPGRQKENWDVYDTYGYYPFDLVRYESISRTLECGYDDWCAGVMAEKLGHAEDAAFFFRRAEGWKKVFDAGNRLVRGKDSKGNWRVPFRPYKVGHEEDVPNDYTEGNAFQYTWHVMQDPQGLVAALGGREAFVRKLDSLFAERGFEEKECEIPDVTGLIGQYVHGNEPSHHVLYFYPQVGRPEKAAERIREVFDKFYLPKPDGLCGNDDCGQMSAWYVFSAMGFYPFNPCGGEYVIGAPQVEKVTLRCRPTPSTYTSFTMIAKNLSKENKYVKSVTLNGKPVADWKIRHADIMAGGELVFEMGSRP